MKKIGDKFGQGIADAPILALAQQIVARARLTGMSANTREQAMNIIRGLRPAPSMRVPLSVLVKSAAHVPLHPEEVCRVCGKDLPIGSLCRTLGLEHINCVQVVAPDYAALCDAACIALEKL